jgi:N-acetylneuraminate synthase/N,N'-diacetyllegionaminate synthase
MHKIKVGERFIGQGEPCFIIAEAGSNHDRNIKQAKQLIDVAVEAGVDAVKFQLYTAETLYSEKSEYFSLFKNSELPWEWLPELAAYAKQKGIMFLATPFDKTAVDQLDKMALPLFKWASQEIVDLPLLRYAASKGKPMMLSTGICNLADIQDAIDAINSAGNNDVVLLHCASLAKYPQKPDQVNLRMLDTMRSAFHLPVGFSDHTVSVVIPAAAVARGASVIEKHFTLGRNLAGLDHSFALEPKELREMVRAIREVEESLGSSIKKRIPEEDEVFVKRPSLIAKSDIPQGVKITEEMLIVKRPGLGIMPKFKDVVVGRETKRKINKGEGVTWDCI